MKISRFFSGSKVVWSYSAGHFPFHILCLNLLLNSTPPEKIRNPLVFRYFRNGFKKSAMKYHSLKSCYYFSECQCFIFLCLMEHLWFTARDHRQIWLQIWSQFKQINFYIRKIIRGFQMLKRVNITFKSKANSSAEKFRISCAYNFENYCFQAIKPESIKSKQNENTKPLGNTSKYSKIFINQKYFTH